MERRARVVDATIRDGSYCVDFQFTAADHAVIAGMLDAAGVGFIEVGHGSGSFHHKAPPSIRSRIRQAASDEQYFAAARKAAPRAKLGVITGTFGADDLPLIAEHRLDFVRLAVMADRALDRANLALAERAKAHGLVFSVNLMQTIAISPARCAQIASEYAKAGADWFYIVDSAGGMLPRIVTDYVSAAGETSSLIVGFHAHHNSGLAIANCLTAIDAGARLVDGTLQGLGRDIGNAPTEQLVLLLQRLGHERDVDVEQLCHAGDLVRGLLQRGNDPTYFAAGISEIHSTNVDALVDHAKRRGLAPRSLLAAIARGDGRLIGSGMTTFPDEVLAPAVARTPRATEPVPTSGAIDVVGEDLARSSTMAVPVLAEVLFARAAKWHRTSVLHLVPRARWPFRGPLPWDLGPLCGFTVGVTRDDVAALDVGDRAPDWLVIDPALVVDPLPAARACCVDAFVPVVIDAALVLATACAPTCKRVWLACSDAAFAEPLVARAAGARCAMLTDPDQAQPADTVIVVGDLTSRWRQLAGRGVRLLRPALAPTIAARVAVLVDLRARLVAAPLQDQLVDPIFVPAPGQIAVDDPQCPGSVIDGGADEIATAAAQRTRALWRGVGRL